MSTKARPKGRDTISINGVSYTHDDIFQVVDDFYTRVQKDPLLQVPFRSVHDWPDHIERLTHFWWIRLGGDPYLFSYYNPVQKHFFAGFNEEFLARWLGLFHETLKTHLKEDQVALWGSVANNMGKALSIKNEMYRRWYEQQGEQK